MNNLAHLLNGTITYSKDEYGKRVDTYPIKYVLNEATKKTSKCSDKDKSKQEEYKEAVRDLKTSWLAKLGKIQQMKLCKIIRHYFLLLQMLVQDRKNYMKSCAQNFLIIFPFIHRICKV